MNNNCKECGSQLHFDKGYLVCYDCGETYENTDMQRSIHHHSQKITGVHGLMMIATPIHKTNKKQKLSEYLDRLKKPEIIQDIEWNEINGLCFLLEINQDKLYFTNTLNNLLVWIISKYYKIKKTLPSYNLNMQYWCNVMNISYNKKNTKTQLCHNFKLDYFNEIYEKYYNS